MDLNRDDAIDRLCLRLTVPDSTPSSPHPPSAKRLLLVDDGHGLPAQVEAALHAAAAPVETRSVAGYLMAMGEVGVSDDAPHAILGPIDTLNGAMAATAAALRELVPRARLIGVTSMPLDAARDRAIAAGFDDCLASPVTSVDLSRSLARGDAGGEEYSSGFATCTAAVSRRETGTLSAAALDTAVIEQLINPHGQAKAEAVRYLQRHSGVTGIDFAEGDVPDDHATAAVAHLGITFGHLHAPSPATVAALEPWAQWLSRWLMLHRQQQDLWFMAMHDELTGAWNRRYFQRFLSMALNRATGDRSTVTLLLFDVDDFKRYNDRYGHAAGDDILRETVKLMQAVVREQDIVARIGGDEFAVIFWDAEAPRRANSRHPADIAKVCERFRKAIAAHKFPKLGAEALGTLTISGGLANFPWDGATPDELMAKADAMALQSKQQGKNVITIGQT